MEEIVYHTNYQLEDSYWWFVARNRLVKKVFGKICNISKGETILDAGCGTGGFAKVMSENYKVYCLDTSALALGYCKKRGLTNLVNSTLGNFKSDGLNIKAVLMLDVVEHIEDDREVVSQVYNHLAEGGYFVATVPAYQWMWSGHDNLHMHYRRYNRKNFNELLVNCGFSIEYSSYFNTLLFPVAFAVRMIEKIFRLKKNRTGVDVVPGFINETLKNIFGFESVILPGCRFPFGLSILTIARKI